MNALVRRWTAVAFAVCALGCQQSDGLVEVSGVVTVDGEPAAQGSITFVPLSGGSRTGAGIAGGRYELRAPRGAAKVVIRVPKVVGQVPMTDPNRPPRPVVQESLPPRFNSSTELVIEVQPAESTHNFDLTTS